MTRAYREAAWGGCERNEGFRVGRRVADKEIVRRFSLNDIIISLFRSLHMIPWLTQPFIKLVTDRYRLGGRRSDGVF